MRHFVTALVLVGLMSASARAEIVEISLPELTGAYPLDEPDPGRFVTIQLDRHPDFIRNAWLHVEGTSVPGLADCGGGGQADVWRMEFNAELDDGTGDWWYSICSSAFLPGQFTSTVVFEPFSGTATWDFLLDGEAVMLFSGLPASEQTICTPIIVPHGNLTEVTLVIDGDFPLPVRASTWGSIKALYR
jgi:hypothetical protein